MKQLKFLLLGMSIVIVQVFAGCAPTSKIAKDRNNIPYIGTWEYQEDDQIFRLVLVEDTEPYEFNKYAIIGHYEMVEVDPATGQETLIYTSRPQPSLSRRNGAIQGAVQYIYGANKVSGYFREFHAHGMLGSFKISTEPADCPTCPKKIRWKLKRMPGSNIHFEGEPIPSETFEVPTDIILEKAN